MSDNALPQHSPSSSLKDRINAALAKIDPVEAYERMCTARSMHLDYALLPLGIKLMTVRPDQVEEKSIERTCMGEGTGDYFTWLQVNRTDVRYGQDVLESGLFGPANESGLCDASFDLQRPDLDLCNVFFALSGGIYELQEEPGLQKLQQGITKHVHSSDHLPTQAFIALVARAPEEGSMQPYRAELVLAVAETDKLDTPVFNLTPFELVQSNSRSSSGKKPLRVKSQLKKVSFGT